MSYLPAKQRNHTDTQKAWLCCMQLIQEFSTWKNWREALSGGQDLILKLRRKQKSETCSKLAKGCDQEAWAITYIFFLRDNWGRMSWFWSASFVDGSFMWLSIAPAISITKASDNQTWWFLTWDLHLSYRCISELSPFLLKVFTHTVLVQRYYGYSLMICWRGLAKKTCLVSHFRFNNWSHSCWIIEEGASQISPVISSQMTRYNTIKNIFWMLLNDTLSAPIVFSFLPPILAL